MAKITIRALSGDISAIAADGLITAINSGGLWFGGIDGVIQRAAGDAFHREAMRRMPLRDGQTVVAMGRGRSRAGFQNVVFVVDDLQLPLADIVYRGLMAADGAGFETVSLPTIRLGVMRGVVEKRIEELLFELIGGIARAAKDNQRTALREVNIVVYDDESLRRRIAALLPKGSIG